LTDTKASAVLDDILTDVESTSHLQVGPVPDWNGDSAPCCYLAVRDRRITRAATLVEGIDPINGTCALHDRERGIRWIQIDGTVPFKAKRRQLPDRSETARH
jgi:hypothetical protein